MENKKNPIYYVILLLKGMAMGAADVVPGVSGGTIAFISGIYEELIDTLNSLNASAFKTLFSNGVKSFWKAINGSFLLTLLTGIGISVLSLAKGISWLLTNQPVLVWSFFFGLVFASILFVGKSIEKWNIKTFIWLVVGAVAALYITQLTASNHSLNWWYLMLSGALAICAMILPGISGAFILLLLGSYETVLEAVHERNIHLIVLVGTGAIIGLLSFSKLLKWMFVHYKNATLALLTGFIAGSLAKIWPWKNVLRSKTIEGKIIPVEVENINPLNYSGEAQIGLAIAMALIGFALIFILEKIATKKN